MFLLSPAPHCAPHFPLLLRSSYNYQGKFLLLAAQQGISLLFCIVAKRFLHGRVGFEVPDVKREQLMASLWPGFLNVANIVVGWYGMALVNIPLFLCVRRTATAIVLFTEYWIRNKVETPGTQLSVAFICLGALVAGWDVILQGDSLGLVYTMVNNFLTAWSHTESKVFADKYNCHGCVRRRRRWRRRRRRRGPCPLDYCLALTPAPLSLSRLGPSSQLWHRALQFNLGAAAHAARRDAAR